MSTPSTPSKATTTNERYLSRSYKQRYTRLGHTAAPTSVMRSPKYTKSPSTHTQLDSSPLFCKRILLQYDGSEKSDSEEDDPDSPSSRGRRSPFASRCASPFLGGWAPRELKEITSSQPILDDEGLFLASKNSATPIPTSSHPRTRPSSSGVRPAIPTFPCLSPLPIVRTQLPQTPAETEWHLGRQTESMTKLSLRDDLCPKRSKIRNKLSLGQFPSSPSPTNRYCGQKRSLDGEQIPRAMGGLFESWAETPTSTSFRLSGGELPAIDSPSLPAPAFNSLVSSSMCNSPMPPISLKLNMVDAQSPQPFSKSNVEPIAKKYRPRDSGIAGLEDSLDLTDKVEPCPLVDDDSIELVTPSLEPSTRSAWPTKPLDDSPGLEQLDDIIFKTLATGVTVNKDKRAVPGTPVKKISYAHSRPWMTVAQAAEVRGVGGTVPSILFFSKPCLDFWSVPRKSLPLSFPSLAQLQNSPDASPSERSLTQRKPYGTLGQGRPNLMINKPNGIRMTLTRRSSSGAFSTSSSEGSFLGTPNKLNLLGKDVMVILESPPYVSSDKHPSTISRRPSPHPPIQFLNKVPNEFECPGKFERDFITLDTLGTGQFGSALKVKYKFGNEQDVFAIKKSKRLEGPKHRLVVQYQTCTTFLLKSLRRRLREEVDVLRHLAALRGPDGHPNVLRYIDSWEQDDVLFIQTEICDLGDLAKFLAEYGTHFVALDEARIWKIAAELINVSILFF